MATGRGVTNFSEFIDALSDGTVDEVLWVGAKNVSSVTLEVFGDINTASYAVRIDVPQGIDYLPKVVDFDGLTIDTVYTHAENREYGEDDASKRKAWVYGFKVFDTLKNTATYGRTDLIIKNLTVNHLILQDPRDIIASGRFYNCYFYDIYAPSCEINSPWLRGSGMTDIDHTYPGQYAFYKKYRLMSNYVFGYDNTTLINGLRTPQTYFTYCILKIRTENAGITFPRASYICCELTLDYELNWFESEKTRAEVEFDNLVLFPAPSFYSLIHSDLRVNCTLKTAWKLAISDILTGQSGNVDITTKTVYYTKEAVVIPRIYKDREFPNADVIEDNNLIGTAYSEGGVDGKYGIAFVTNGGDIHLLNTTPDAAEVLYGDLRNPDIMVKHGCNFVEDDGERKAQYGLEYEDYKGGSQIGFDDDETWYRRRYAGTNDGIPFLPFWYYPYHDEPSGGGTVDGGYISVYDMDTKQDEFDNNGLILEPTQCRVVEELNGGYNLTLEHPYDKDGKWRHILEHNIIKCMGQLFIIRKVSSISKANSKSVTAYAEHISYHLQDYWLFPGTSIAGYVGQTLIDSILAQMWDVPWDEENNLRYTFDIKTNLSADESFREWYEMPEGHTPYEMILGSNGFTSLIGGELYRDNFNISIYERMQGAKDNAFVLHPDLNLKSIQKTVDLQTFCTYFRGYDPYGGWFAIAWDPRTLPRAYPHNIVRSQNFTFDVAEEYYEFGMLTRKVGEYFKRMCAPLVSFKIQVQDLKNHPEYKDFVNNYRFKVGDIGKVWDDDADRYYDLEITRTVKDGITGECIEVVIGTERSFTRPNTTPITLDRNYGTIEAGEYDPDVPPEPEPDPPSIDDYIWTQDDDKAAILYYIGSGRNIQIPSEFVTASLQTIKATAFCDNQIRLLKAVIPDGTEVIE